VPFYLRQDVGLSDHHIRITEVQRTGDELRLLLQVVNTGTEDLRLTPLIFRPEVAGGSLTPLMDAAAWTIDTPIPPRQRFGVVVTYRLDGEPSSVKVHYNPALADDRHVLFDLSRNTALR
jgi:hypothetical protein